MSEETNKINNTFNELVNLVTDKDIKKKETGKKLKSGEKEELSYLSWAKALEFVYSRFNNNEVEIHIYENERRDNLPIFGDDDIGFYVKTHVAIKGERKYMMLPVMDSKNKALKRHPYSYTVKFGDKLTEKTVAAINMFDINTTIQRCIVKNLAQFGLGIKLYMGEDLLDMKDEDNATQETQASLTKELELKRVKIKQIMENNLDKLDVNGIEWLNTHIINAKKLTADNIQLAFNAFANKNIYLTKERN